MEPAGGLLQGFDHPVKVVAHSDLLKLFLAVSMIRQVISHYRVIDQIGAGGMGVVYRAEDTRLGRPLVLKFLPAALSRDPMALERFEREAKTASSMNHPGICTVYDIGEFEGQQYIAMEDPEGQPLDRFIGGKPVALSMMLDLGVQITDRLSWRTARASCTATSSPPTSSSPSAGTPRCSTSAWPSSRPVALPRRPWTQPRRPSRLRS